MDKPDQQVQTANITVKSPEKKKKLSRSTCRYFDNRDTAQDTVSDVKEFTINTWKIERAKKKKKWREKKYGKGQGKTISAANIQSFKNRQLSAHINKTESGDTDIGRISDEKGGMGRSEDQIKRKKTQSQKQRMQKGKVSGHFRENERDPFPGSKPIPETVIKKYERGEHVQNPQTKSAFGSKLLKKKEEKLKFVAKQAARAELIMQEEAGFLEADDNEDTGSITQHDLADIVDITSAQKFFELKLTDFGPYRMNYTRNGRFLLLGGAKGHVAAIDWMTKKLLCEINVMETLHDVRWLHQETMYAIAQKQWTYIYDNQGIELHCLKVLDRVLRMEFLPYHFLLASANVAGYLTYIDVSVGEKVAGYGTGQGRLDVMCQNPSNAVIHLGHPQGTVTLWSPKVKNPLVNMLCHRSGVRSIAIDKSGQYMASSGIDRMLKIWDLRNYKTLQSYRLGAGAGHLTFSQTGLLAAGVGNIVQIYQDCVRQTVTKPYMVHNLTSSVNSLQFCPYEDVLGVGHGNGFSSLIIPGAGEANFDALEANPYQTKKQRREAEVKMLLDKIPAEMINIDSGVIGRVDKKTLEEKQEEKLKLNKHMVYKTTKKDFKPKYKMKGKSKTGKFEQRKRGVIEEDRRAQIKERLKLRQEEEKEKHHSESRTLTSGNVLDRFIRKDT